MRIEAEKKDNVAEKNKTALNENADIYGKRKENLKLSELKGKEKWSYFKSYYLGKVLMAIAAAGILTWILISILTPKPENILTIAVSENPLSEETIGRMTEEISERIVKDSDKEAVFFDTAYYLSDLSTGAYSAMKITTMIMSNDLDAMILPREYFETQTNGGSVVPVANVLSAEELEKMSEYLVRYTPYDEDVATGEKNYYPEDNYGILFNPYLESLGIDTGGVAYDYILCFAVGTQHTDNCRELVHYIYDNLE